MLENCCDVHSRRRNFNLPFEEPDGFAQILNRDDLQPLHHGGFRRVVFRHENADLVLGLGLDRDWQNALHRPHGAGQSEFTDDHKIFQLIGNELLARGQHSQGDG